MRRTKWSALAFLFSGALILAACGQQGASPSAAPDDESAAPEESAEATGFGDTIVQALDAQVGNIGNATNDVPSQRLAYLVFDTLYILDDTLTPVPLLAADLCDVSEDELVWTCTLKEGATFHNGDPVTIDDVVYTYQLSVSANCTYNPSVCLTDFVESVEAVDESTVEFTMIEPYAPFATSALSAIGIESQAVIEAAFEEFTGGTGELTAEDVTAVEESITAATGADPADDAACEAAAAEGTAILDQAGVEYGAVGDFAVEDDPETADVDETDSGQCPFAASLLEPIGGIAAGLESTGVDAVAAVYNLLSFNKAPIGAGPYQLESCTLEGCVLTAFADYHLGAPVTQTIEMPIFTDIATAAQALAAGELDWVNDLTPDARAALEGPVADGSVKLAQYNDFGYFGLMYNMHESTVLPDGTEWQGFFYDINLRQAIQLCVDKPTLVEVATDGNGVPIEADIPPASWAFNPNLTAPARDIEAGRALIESATVHTWTEGADGIYVNELGEPLQSTVLVRAGQQDRVDFMNLLAEQVLECGIDIEVVPADFQTVLIPSLDYPHIPAGADEPWHAYFGGWGLGADPDAYSLFHGSQCSTEDNPSTFNYICLQDDEIDRLLEEGLATSDQEERTQIYWEYQERMQELQPYLFAWSNINADGLDVAFVYSDGELELDSPNWGWRRHMLAIESGE